MKTKKTPDWVVKPLVPKEVYTNREEFLEYFYKAALEAATRRTMSTVLLGQRRMGKTEIFKRVVNRLFFEQDHKSPDAVAPVYFSFPDTIENKKDFAIKYLENFMLYYMAFYTNQPEMIMSNPKGKRLLKAAKDIRSCFPFQRTLDLLLDWHEDIVKEYSVIPHQDALEIPRRISDINDSTIVMFLDEFQNTRLP